MESIIKEIPIKDIVFDEQIYPREKSNWLTIIKYKDHVVLGDKFPPIILCQSYNQLILVDGKHRIEAYKQAGHTKINASIYFNWTRKKMFEEAIKRNMEHGLGLSPYDLRNIYVRLKELKYSDKKVSEIIKVPLGELKMFIAKRSVTITPMDYPMRNAITGKVISGGNDEISKIMVLKSGLKHLAGTEITASQAETIKGVQSDLYLHDQLEILDKIISMLQAGLFDTKNELIKMRLKEIKEMIE